MDPTGKMTEPSKPILIGERVRIYPRGKKKTYCADFWFDGKHQRRSLKTRNLKIARQKALQLEARLITGMRSGELQRLRLEDIDLKGNWIQIVSREGAETKTGYSRKVPIHAKLKPFLEALPKTGPWLFTAPPSRKYPAGGHWINTKHLNEDFSKLLTVTGVAAGRKKGGFSIHSLRNSFETICVNAAIPQRVVDTWLGHRTDRSMASVYYKLSDEDSQKFMLKVPLGTGEPAADVGEN